MSLQYSIQESEDSVLVPMAGRLTLGPHLRSFGQQVAAAIEGKRPESVLLLCEELDEVDSAGLGELVILFTIASEHGGRVMLVRPQPRLRRLLEATKLDGLLPQFESAAEARASLLQMDS